MLGVLLALWIGAAAPEPESKLSAQAQAVIAPVAEAIERERHAQAALPPPAGDSERLLRMGRLDQAGRALLSKIDLTVLPADEIVAARKAMFSPIAAVDQANAAELLRMLPAEGWFFKSRYGEKPANAAFLIVQHSDVELWRRFVPVLEPLVAQGEIPGQSYGLMYDRLALAEGRPQRYGSQMTCKDGRWVVDTLENPETVDQRRKAMGFYETLAEYQAYFAKYPPCTD